MKYTKKILHSLVANPDPQTRFCITTRYSTDHNLIDLISAIQNFDIAKNSDLQLERDNIRKQQEVQNMQAKPDRRELGTELGTVLDSKVLGQLYQAREKVGTKSQISAKALQRFSGSRGVYH